MAFTNTDLTNVEAAIVALATGEREVSVSLGDKQIRYAEAEIDKLRTLRTEIKTELQAGAGRRRFLLTQTSKGL